MFGGGGGGGTTNNYTQEIRDEEAQRQERVREGTKKIEDLFGSQFTNDFYGAREKSYTDYALPQLNEQNKDASKQLTFSLDRRGALDSSSRSDLEASLAKRRALVETEIKDKARQFGTEARAGVEGARSDLINTLNATGDVEATVNSANARAKVLSQPSAYSPIAQAFGDITTALGQQAAAERAFSYGAGPRPAVVTGLFGARNGAVVNS